MADWGINSFTFSYSTWQTGAEKKIIYIYIYIFILVVNIFQVALQTKTPKLSYIPSPLFLQGEGEDEHHGV